MHTLDALLFSICFTTKWGQMNIGIVWKPFHWLTKNSTILKKKMEEKWILSFWWLWVRMPSPGSIALKPKIFSLVKKNECTAIILIEERRFRYSARPWCLKKHAVSRWKSWTHSWMLSKWHGQPQTQTHALGAQDLSTQAFPTLPFTKRKKPSFWLPLPLFFYDQGDL